jgi:hypothetical protein
MDRFIGFGRDVVNGRLEAGAFTFAASPAYYAIFAIAPLLLMLSYDWKPSGLVVRLSAPTDPHRRLTRSTIRGASRAIKQMLDAAGTAQSEGWSAGTFCVVAQLSARRLSPRQIISFVRPSTATLGRKYV